MIALDGKILKDKGITIVVTLGTSAQGAILYTASGATLRGLKVQDEGSVLSQSKC